MLAAPWALLALIGVPIVFGIYFFRTRSRRVEVSTLFLWVDRSQAKQGGRQIKRAQLPFLIILELIVIILLALAAARPMIHLESAGSPTVIILDTSYSMLAGKINDTSQQRAIDDLQKLFESGIGYPVQFIFAGSKPQLLTERAMNAAEARNAIKSWTCYSPTSDINAAVSLSTTICSPDTKILVVTDTPPLDKVDRRNLLWKSYGKDNDNLGIIHASRTMQDNKDKLLIEIANFSNKPQNLNMAIIETKNSNILFKDQRQLKPDEIHRIRTTIKKDCGAIEVRLDEDLLSLDNRVILLPPSQRHVRVKIGTFPADLAGKIKRAVEASGIGEIVQDDAELIFDSSVQNTANNVDANANPKRPIWTVHILTEADEKNVKSYVRPFIIDRASQITNGLTLEGVVWSCNENTRIGGNVIISAGDIPLMTDERRRNNSRIIHLKINDRVSTLTSNPAWPILIWNILRYRSNQKTGFTTSNIKLGAEAEFMSSEGDRLLEVTTPSNEKKTLTITTGLNVHSANVPVRIPADQVGLYKIRSNSGNY
ncbi:MAG: VWA domain-containing protein, partial [Planctomycetaceae bacterium]|nr:VWA domain-containing protein [Planctomycetaceae bacterium]